MAEQASFITDVRAAVEQLFAHRKVLRRVMVRFAFWPDGLVISAKVSMKEGDGYRPEKEEMLAAHRQEIVSWDRLATIDPAEFMAIVDRVCQPSHDLMAKGVI